MTIKQLIANSAKYFSIGLGVMTVDTYISGKLDSNKTKIIKDLTAENKDLTDKCMKLLETQIENESLKAKVFSVLEELKTNSTLTKESVEKMKKLVSNLQNNNQTATDNSDLSYYAEELSRAFSAENKTLTKLLESIKSSIDTSSNIRSTDLYEYINQYKEFLSTLSIEQTGALANIICAIVIFFCLLTLISVFFSEILLKYFNLESKYPKLARFILIRRQFQKYYFILNSLIIFIVLLTIIFINILSFY